MWAASMLTIAFKVGLDSKLWHLGLEVDWQSMEIALVFLAIGVLTFEWIVPVPCWPNSFL